MSITNGALASNLLPSIDLAENIQLVLRMCIFILFSKVYTHIHRITLIYISKITWNIPSRCLRSFNIYLILLTIIYFSGYPRNPFNDVVCNDTISASGVFTAKELCRLSKSNYQNTLSCSCKLAKYVGFGTKYNSNIDYYFSFNNGRIKWHAWRGKQCWIWRIKRCQVGRSRILLQLLYTSSSSWPWIIINYVQ